MIATSGVVYNKESEYGGAKVKMGQQVVRMTVMGQVSTTHCWQLMSAGASASHSHSRNKSPAAFVSSSPVAAAWPCP